MTNEIKEMLDNMKEISSFEYTTDWFELNYEDTKILLDYITNLQEEKEKQHKGFLAVCKEAKDLEQRIDKALEKLDDTRMIYKEELINILRGDE